MKGPLTSLRKEGAKPLIRIHCLALLSEVSIRLDNPSGTEAPLQVIPEREREREREKRTWIPCSRQYSYPTSLSKSFLIASSRDLFSLQGTPILPPSMNLQFGSQPGQLFESRKSVEVLVVHCEMVVGVVCLLSASGRTVQANNFSHGASAIVLCTGCVIKDGCFSSLEKAERITEDLAVTMQGSKVSA